MFISRRTKKRFTSEVVKQYSSINRYIPHLARRLSCILLSCILIVSLSGLLGACKPIKYKHFKYVIDDAIQPSLPEIPGLDGGLPRQVSVSINPDGTKEEFVVNEVIFHPESSDELDDFLAKYDGTVLRDGSPFLIPGIPHVDDDPEPSGFYLIKVDLERSSLSDIEPNMEAAKITGRFRFSSENGVRLAALIAREKDLGLSANPLMRPQAVVPEHPIQISSLHAFIGKFLAPNEVWLNGATAEGLPSGSFRNSGQTLGANATRDVALADLDGDFDRDAFVVNSGGFATSHNKVWLNDGSGAFSDSGQNLGTFDSQGVALVDLDGNSNVDAFVVNGSGQANKVWLNDGSGTFSDSGQNLGTFDSQGVVWWDLDGDSDIDVFVVNGSEQANKVWLNDGNGVFSDSGQTLGDSNSQGVALADLDGDSDRDAFVVNGSGEVNKVWLNDGNGVFSDSGQTLGDSNSQGVALADLDDDSDWDAFVVNGSSQANKVWLNDGNGVFSDSGQTLGDFNSQDVALADLDGDSDVDAFVANVGGAVEKGSRVWINNGSGIFIDSGQELESSSAVALSDLTPLANVDAATFPWMTEDDDPFTPGDQGLSVGVIRAWEYLRYHGLPPTEGEFSPPIVAIIDGGFALDTDTGLPLNGNLDYFPLGLTSRQIDLLDYDTTAGGINPLTCDGFLCPWHGQGAFGVAAAYPRNLFGSAGTGGNVVRPMLVKVFTAYSVADGIRSAYLNGADVISLSLSLDANKCEAPVIGSLPSWTCGIPPDDISTYMQSSILLATTGGSVVIAGAGNDQVDLNDGLKIIPCELNQVICVGSVLLDPEASDSNATENVFNYGSTVDIWAPTDILTTPNPNTIGNTDINVLPLFGGTSASTPFVAGIAGLMKALDPLLRWNDIQTILQDTANSSTDDKVTKGYVDAFRAVERVRPNQSPSVNITKPADEATVSFGRRVTFFADVIDPESEDRFRGKVEFSSDIDGELCTAPCIFENSSQLSVGTHEITATATDPFDAVGTDSIALNVVNNAPTARIQQPPTDSTFFTSQEINFRGFGFDVDEPIPDVNLEWSSSIVGSFGTGRDFFASLPEGTQTITLRATDVLGLTGEDSITVIVQEGEGFPTARILSPSNFEPFPAGAVITFTGEGIDPEDGELTGSALTWSSDFDGVIGEGNTIDVVLSSQSNGDIRFHTITLQVEDSDGNASTNNIGVFVGQIP